MHQLWRRNIKKAAKEDVKKAAKEDVEITVSARGGDLKAFHDLHAHTARGWGRVVEVELAAGEARWLDAKQHYRENVGTPTPRPFSSSSRTSGCRQQRVPVPAGTATPLELTAAIAPRRSTRAGPWRNPAISACQRRLPSGALDEQNVCRVTSIGTVVVMTCLEECAPAQSRVDPVGGPRARTV
jgi:hypothetical protein